MSEILTFSEKAKIRLKEIMSNIDKKTIGLRISVKSGGCAGMTYQMDYVEKKIEGDEKIVIDEVDVFIDRKALTGLFFVSKFLIIIFDWFETIAPLHPRGLKGLIGVSAKY